MKALITVIGIDKVGIIAGVSSLLADAQANVLDISQTILDNYFTMMMLVDLSGLSCEFAELKKRLEQCGEDLGVSVQLQHEDFFRSMHRI